MTYLADAGFDVFATDLQGYGSSSKPTVMDDPCNTSADNQSKYLAPNPLPAPCRRPSVSRGEMLPPRCGWRKRSEQTASKHPACDRHTAFIQRALSCSFSAHVRGVGCPFVAAPS
jgi:pimeloyl-ACP methyl ester carboxylesterase